MLAAPAFAQTPAKATPVGANFQFPSNEFNKDLPKWLKFSGVYQGRVEGFSGGGFRNNNSDAYYLNRFRINMNINPTPWLRFSFQMQDARVFGKNTVPGPPFQDTLDLRVAYAEFGDSGEQEVGVREAVRNSCSAICG